MRRNIFAANTALYFWFEQGKKLFLICGDVLYFHRAHFAVKAAIARVNSRFGLHLVTNVKLLVLK